MCSLVLEYSKSFLNITQHKRKANLAYLRLESPVIQSVQIVFHLFGQSVIK